MEQRKLQEIGSSLLVSLPKAWIRSHKLKKGALVHLLASEQGRLVISPKQVPQDTQRSATISFDEHVKRRFVREYFGGNTTIVIKLTKSVSESARKEFYAFIELLINAQIIEENKQHIVVRCFHISELSILECLDRMYHLSVGIAQETHSQTKIQELVKNSKGFYYLLVMQVRRFVEEGQYAQENQLSIIRVLDARMVAEKIARITRLLAREYFSSNLKSFLEYYHTAYWAFRNESFSQAVGLDTLKKNDEIYRLARDISMLVR